MITVIERTFLGSVDGPTHRVRCDGHVASVGSQWAYANTYDASSTMGNAYNNIYIASYTLHIAYHGGTIGNARRLQGYGVGVRSALPPMCYYLPTVCPMEMLRG